jgi:hypothetical protein
MATRKWAEGLGEQKCETQSKVEKPFRSQESQEESELTVLLPASTFHSIGFAGPSRIAAAKAPAIPHALEFKSQRKLDLPLAILYLLSRMPIARHFRERANVSCITGENFDLES